MKCCHILPVLLISLGCKAAAVEAPEKPNVLFLMADDLNTALSGFGHPQCKTPNLDRLARRGVKFESMHCQYPVCGASRASIMSGLYPYTNKTTGNGGNLRTSMPNGITMSQAFKNQGYYTARVSKIYHMSIPTEIIEGTAHSDDPYSWDEAFNITAPEQNAPGEKTNWSPANTTSQAFVGVVSTAGDLEHADGMAADKAIELLDQVKDKPFFLAVGFVRPHVPLVAPAKYFDLYDRDAMQIPYVPKNDLEDLPAVARNYKTNADYGVTPESHKGLLEAYYASVSYMDAQVGRVLDALEEKGLMDSTLVVFTSDHGYHLGHHGKYQKMHLFEETTRVPFIISVPWMTSEHDKGTHQLTELIDLYPTLTDLVGIPAPESLQGTSMRPLLEDTDSPAWETDAVFTVSRTGGESLRTKEWRFTQWGFGKSGMELYDLKNDPGEFTNQANNLEYAPEVERLKKRLLLKRDEAGYQSFMAAKNAKQNAKKSRKNKKNK